MPISMTPQAQERIQSSLIEDQEGKNEFEREAEFLEQQNIDVLENLGNKVGKDETYTAFWDYFLNFLFVSIFYSERN